MRKLLPFAALLTIGGCGASAGSEEGAPPPPVKPVTQSTLESMPAQARGAAQGSMQAGAATAEQMNKRYGGGNK